MTRVLVTGARGFVGGFVCQALAMRGVDVVATGRSEDGGGGMTRDRMRLGPDTSPEDMRQMLEGASAVVHLAAAVHDMRGATSQSEYRRANRDFPLQLAKTAERAGVHRFVFVSTIKVNGENTQRGNAFDESSPVAPQGPYACSKWQAEEGLRELSAASGIETRIVRPPLVYGAGVRANFRSLLRWVRRGIPLPFEGFDNIRSLIYAGNLADVLARLALGEDGSAASRTYLVSDGEDVSTAELVRRMAVALHVVPRLFHVPDRAFRLGLSILRKREMAARLMDSLKIDATLMRRELGWTPPFSIDEGLSLTATWFLGQP
jgi:nucleoside-diphosphate-sugar epimerase